MLAGQKRELFTWYRAQFLYDMMHRPNPVNLRPKAGTTCEAGVDFAAAAMDLGEGKGNGRIQSGVAVPAFRSESCG
jgi:hypothetical protein